MISGVLAMPPHPFEGDVVVVRPRWGLVAAQVLLSLVFVAASVIAWVMAGGHASSMLTPAYSSLVWMFNIAIISRLARRRWPRSSRARIRADARGVSIGGALQVPRGSLRAAFSVPATPPRVRLARRHGLPVDIVVKDADEAGALLAALELGTPEALASFDIASVGWRYYASVALAFGAVGLLAHGFLPREGWEGWVQALQFACLSVVGVAFAAARGRVDVGTDGLLLVRSGSAEFIAYRDLDAAVPIGEQKVELRYRGRREVRVTVRDVREGLRYALVERIAQARNAGSVEESGTDLGALFAPAGRSPRDWVKFARGMARAQGYRAAAWGSDALWRIVEDPKNEAGVRAGAAVALAPSLDAPGRERLRVAATVSASPALRVALEAAAGEEDEPLEEALEPLARIARG
jgi:hypothetical protein